MPVRYYKLIEMSEIYTRRFWSHVDKRGHDECWPWLKNRRKGYGRFGMNKKSYKANRIAYFLEHGRDPGEHLVCHSCDNPPCCNPNHLYLATNAENQSDMVAKGRAASGDRNGARLHPEKWGPGIKRYYATHPGVKAGEMNGFSKLTEENVRTIRSRVAAGEYQYIVAQDYGITQANVNSIVLRKTWKHVI